MQNHVQPEDSATIRERHERARYCANAPQRKFIPRSAPEKPTLQQIREQARTIEGQPITRQELAALTGLQLTDVYVIDIGGHNSGENIRAVLRVFNELTGKALTIDDIRHGVILE